MRNAWGWAAAAVAVVAAAGTAAAVALGSSLQSAPPSPAMKRSTMDRGTARKLIAADSKTRVWNRVAAITVLSLGLPSLLFVAVILLAQPRTNEHAVNVILGFSQPFAGSVPFVMPTLVAVLVGLAVVQSVGWLSDYVSYAAAGVSTLAATWAAFTAFAPLGFAFSSAIGDDACDTTAEPWCSVAQLVSGAEARDAWVSLAAAVALAVVAISIGVIIPELQPRGEEARAEQRRRQADDLRTLSALQEALARRATRGETYELRRARQIDKWWFYGIPAAMSLCAIPMLVPTATSRAEPPGLLLLTFGPALLGMLMLGYAVEALATAGASKWAGFAFYTTGGLLLTGVPLALATMSTILTGDPLRALALVLEAAVFVVLLVAVYLPLTGILRRRGLFAQAYSAKQWRRTDARVDSITELDLAAAVLNEAPIAAAQRV